MFMLVIYDILIGKNYLFLKSTGINNTEIKKRACPAKHLYLLVLLDHLTDLVVL